jgi:hypothetical protein
LQYNRTTETYQFAATQLEYLGKKGEEADVIDLFCWGTGNNPTATDAKETTFTDWGSKINDGNAWFTLSADEWAYLIGDEDYSSNKRDNATNLRKWTTIDGVNGLVILPDECTASISDDWATLEAAGAVFLPCGTTSEGKYWSSSSPRSGIAFYFFFNSDGRVYETTIRSNNWYAVRLVRSL